MNNNFNSLSAARLKSERLKLNKKQAEAAGLCGVSREMWGKYERGLATPGGEVLFSFAAAGADMHYILTGETKQDQLLKAIKEATGKVADLPLLSECKAAIAQLLTGLQVDNMDLITDALDIIRSDYVGLGKVQNTAEASQDNLTIAEKDLIDAYRKAAQPDKAFMERLAELAANATKDEAEPESEKDVEGK
jgi:transcriptional regulator with XRE-family HTH domain